MTEVKKEVKVETKKEEISTLNASHAQYSVVGINVEIAFDSKAKKDVLIVNGTEIKPTYDEALKLLKNETKARRVILFAVNEYPIKGYSRADVLCGIAK